MAPSQADAVHVLFLLFLGLLATDDGVLFQYQLHFIGVDAGGDRDNAVAYLLVDDDIGNLAAIDGGDKEGAFFCDREGVERQCAVRVELEGAFG